MDLERPRPHFLQENIQSDAQDKQELPHIPGRGRYTEEARRNRIDFLQARLGRNLPSFSESPFKAESLKGNIENYIGALTIPIGLAGPLLVRNAQGQTEEVYAPIATTEGALVASVTRGARAISLSGGVRARVLKQRMHRAPMFEFDSLDEAIEFAEWIQKMLPQIQSQVRKYSNYAQLLEIQARHQGRCVHLRFIYSTRDAAGQNMTTVCTWNTCQWLLELLQTESRFHLRNFVLEGNLSSDKKASFSSQMQGRGIEVIAEAVIQGSVLKDVLRVDVDTLVHQTNLAKAARSQGGFLGWNINVANVIAGMFAATGQDMACVHESSVAEFHLEPQVESNGEKNLYISMHLPCLVIGTVGGGTSLPVQSEMLDLLGCRGGGKVSRLAEIIAGFSLALDLSTISAISAGQFADAHSRLGRSKVSSWLKRGEMDDSFVAGLSDLGEARVVSLKPIQDAGFGNSLMMDMSSSVTQKLCGFFPFEIEYRAKDSVEIQTRKVLLKIKPKDDEVVLGAELMASMCGEELKRAFQKIRPLNLFQKSHVKEIHVHSLPEAQKISPQVYGSWIEEGRQIYLLAQEFIADFSVAPTADDVSFWNRQRLEASLEAIASFHGRLQPRAEEFLARPWIGYVPDDFHLRAMKDFFRELADFAVKESASWASPEQTSRHRKIVETLEQWAPVLEGPARTLIHNDFNPRNIGFRRRGQSEEMVTFDWELATVGLPQRDVVELLSFTLAPDCRREEVLGYLEIHRQALENAGGMTQSRRDYLRGAQASLNEFIVHRLSLYFVADSLRECAFLPRTYAAALRIAAHLEEEMKNT